jgi:allantoin racemase
MRIANIAATGTFEPPELPRHLISADVEVETVAVDYFVYPGNPFDAMLDDLAYVEAAVRAEAAGFDVVYINSTADYGIEQARSAVRVPVVGAGQASMMMAASLGRTFSIVTVWPSSLRSLNEKVVRNYAMTDRCVSIRHVAAESEMRTVTDDDSFYHGMVRGREDMLARISSEIQVAVEVDGADVIVLGCTCMSPVAVELGRRTTVPVVDAAVAGYLAAEAAGRTGLTHSPTAYAPVADPRHAMLRDMTGAAARALESAGDYAEACEICEVIRSEEPVSASAAS